jgi:hypothetical protein
MFTDTSHAAIVAATKAEILVDIANGTVPATVSTFSELHDYVDANMYADELICNRLMDGDEYLSFINAVTDEVDAWLRAGRPATWLPTGNEDVPSYVNGKGYIENNEDGYLWELYALDVNTPAGINPVVADGTAPTLAEAITAVAAVTE